MIDLKTLTIKEARKKLDAKEFSARDLVSAYLKEIESKNQSINAYLEVYKDVLDQADSAQALIDSGQAKILTGIPFAIKDNILIKGKIATSASKILEGFVAPYDATAISKLKSQGAIFLGRTNMDEFAMGGSTENSAFGPTRNPKDTSRVSGGSSGGSIAAVAGNMALASLGSDTGGSVREPAAFCGIVGLKPTYGAVSRHGLMAMGSSLDCIGPATKTVTDAEIIFDVIKGLDPLDSTTYPESLYGSEKKEAKTLGVPYHLVNAEGIEPEIKKNFDESVEKLKSLGFVIKEISLPNIDYALAVYYILMPAEVSSNMARFDGVKYGAHVDGQNLVDDYLKTRGQGFGKEVRRRILIGTYVLSTGYYDAFYGKALMVRDMLREDLNKAFSDVDAIITPTAPVPAWKIGEKSDPLSVYLADIFTVTANIVGVPALSVPSGSMKVEDKDLPIGLQIMAKHGAESTLFNIGKKFLGEI
jgi:aspartyl-tRNA(Asn)/glutamyl-tRNA(Gln) amidotransferase subunit A